MSGIERFTATINKAPPKAASRRKMEFCPLLDIIHQFCRSDTYAYVGGNPSNSVFSNDASLFQPTPPRGGRPAVRQSLIYQPSAVSTHAPAWGATTAKRITEVMDEFQPTPPRGGRQKPRRECRNYEVSTHAPAWGATSPLIQRHAFSGCFNPRPRVGGDPGTTPGPSLHHRFNPRPRVGGDLEADRAENEGLRFNPRPRVGGDTSASTLRTRRRRFNPRPRVGGDKGTASQVQLASSFNPRPRVGGDECNSIHCLLSNVSTHAPAWGATKDPGAVSHDGLFQPTPLRGGRPA